MYILFKYKIVIILLDSFPLFRIKIIAFYHFCRITSYNRIWWDVFCYNRICCYYAMLAYSYTRKDMASKSKPSSFFYYYWTFVYNILFVYRLIDIFIAMRMISHMNKGSKKDIVLNCNGIG